MTPTVSVLMPAYRQPAFIHRAIQSLLRQSCPEWELIAVDDGSKDGTPLHVRTYLSDSRIRLITLPENRGLGAALNTALEAARARYIAYLPCDDVYHRDHLSTLCAWLDSDPLTVLAYSGVRHHYNRYSLGRITEYPLQLVQVMHRHTTDRWATREEITTDDLDVMFWDRLRARGAFSGTGRVTCEWVDHAGQRHKRLRESEGGINSYRQYCETRGPLRVRSTRGNLIDEKSLYSRYKGKSRPRKSDGLKILLVGELAYNPDRILALGERGHRLFGLWMRNPWWYNTVGPLPFGEVEEIEFTRWREEITRIKPDVIYALLNWQAVPFAHEVLTTAPDIPFVWHFKEGPFICLERGTFPELIRLYTLARGRIYCNAETRDWFHRVLPVEARGGREFILDGDLPKSEWFTDECSPKLSEVDGAIHTVVPGRPIGLHPQDVAVLGRKGVHLHFYGDFAHGEWRGWIAKAESLANGCLHLHAHVDPDAWVREFSRYDAGWLHYVESRNKGDLARMNWDDLNYPARLTTLAAAGLPLLQRTNPDSIVAVQNLARQCDIGVFAESMEHLAAQLHDKRRLKELQSNMWTNRAHFTFDHYADRLLAFFHSVIGTRN